MSVLTVEARINRSIEPAPGAGEQPGKEEAAVAVAVAPGLAARRGLRRRPSLRGLGALAGARARPYWVLLAVHGLVAAFYLFVPASGEPAGLSRLPIDEAWVRMVYARSFAENFTFDFNPGQPEAGITSPLWAVLVGLGWKASGGAGIDIAAVAKALGVLFGVLSSMMVLGILRQITGNARLAFIAALVVAVEPTFAFASVSGMEVTLYSFLALASAWLFLNGHLMRSGLAFALLVAARPEGVVLVIIATLAIAARRVWERDELQLVTREDALVLAKLLAPSVLLLLLGAGYDFSVNGGPMPNAFYAKHVDMGVAPVGNIANVLKGYFHHLTFFSSALFPFTAATAGAGIWFLLRRYNAFAAPLALFLIGQTYAIAFTIPMSPRTWSFIERRYLDATIPFIAILLVLGLAEIWRVLHAWRATRTPADPTEARVFNFSLNSLFIALIAFPLIGFPGGYRRLPSDYSWNARNINDVNVTAARWISEHTPEDAAIATGDPGALRFFSNRRIIDFKGNNYHQAIGKQALDVAEDLRVDYAFVFRSVHFDSWPQGRGVFQVEIDHNTILPDKIMKGYQALWDVKISVADRSQPYQIDFDAIGMKVIDEIDVGNASASSEAAESTHDYKVLGESATADKVFRVAPNVTLEDDARVFSGSEEFVVKSAAGQRLGIVKRYDATIGSRVRVFVDGKDAGVWNLEKKDFFFGEEMLVIPGELITRNFTTLRFEVLPGPETPTANSFYYWILIDKPAVEAQPA